MACYAIGSQMTLRCRKIFCSHSGTLRQLYAPTFVPPFTQKIGSYRGLLASLFKLHGSQRENARRAIILQNFWANHAARVTQVWKQAMLDNPSLDYTVSHPTENNAVPIELAKQRALENKAIAHFAKDNALFFYYRGNNALDQLLAKNVIRFCGEHQLRLVGISMDGKLIAGITMNAVNNGKASYDNFWCMTV